MPASGRKYPKSKIPGIMGHQAEVDTSGMDEEMKRTLGVGKGKPKPGNLLRRLGTPRPKPPKPRARPLSK